MPANRERPLSSDQDLIDQLAAFGLTLEAAIEKAKPLAETPHSQMVVEADLAPRDPRRSLRVAIVASAASLIALIAAATLIFQSSGQRIRSDDNGPATNSQIIRGGRDVEQKGSGTADSTDHSVARLPIRILATDGSILAEIPVPNDKQWPESFGVLDYTLASDQPEGANTFVNFVLAELATGWAGSTEPAEIFAGGGWTIQTSFDPKAQTAALRAKEETIPANATGLTTTIITLDTHSGAVRALVTDTRSDSRGVGPLEPRQPGSAMKVFVLAALFEAGFNPLDTVRTDGPCRFLASEEFDDIYTVAGSEGQPETLARVTAVSNNCAFVRAAQVVGNPKVVEMARSLGITGLPPEADSAASLPLGVFPLDALELTAAYATFGNDGWHNQPWFIERIFDSENTTVFEHQSAPEAAMTEQSARQLTEVLELNVLTGTGRRAALDDGHPAAGKTGSTQRQRDAWFVGYTDYYTTAVQITGTPEFEEAETVEVEGFGPLFGGGAPAQIWGAYNNELHSGLEPKVFVKPTEVDGGRLLTAETEVVPCGTEADLADEGLYGKKLSIVEAEDGRRCVVLD